MVVLSNAVAVSLNADENARFNAAYYDEQAEDASFSVLRQVYGDALHIKEGK